MSREEVIKKGKGKFTTDIGGSSAQWELGYDSELEYYFGTLEVSDIPDIEFYYEQKFSDDYEDNIYIGYVHTPKNSRKQIYRGTGREKCIKAIEKEASKILKNTKKKVSEGNIRGKIDLILEGLNRVDESDSNNHVSFGKTLKGLSDKDKIDIVSHIWIMKGDKEVSINTDDFDGIVVDIEQYKDSDSYNIIIRKNKNKPWSKNWTKILKSWGETPYTNGYMLTGFKSSSELKDFVKRRNDVIAKEEEEIRKKAPSVIKKFIGKNVTFYDYEYGDDFKIVKQSGNKVVVDYDNGGSKELTLDYLINDTEFGDEIDID